MVGSLISIIGMFLPWISSGGDSQTGTGIFLDSGFTIYEDPGAGVIVFAVITRGLGVALFFAGRILAVAISAIVVAQSFVFSRPPQGVDRGDTAMCGHGSVGFGAILQPIAPLVTLAGSIVATAKRRKWPTA
jgi:hypothetical protein